MLTNLPRCSPKHLLRLVSLLLFVLSSAVLAQAATNKSPVLISDSNSTRGIALEAVTLKAEPFSLTSSVKFSNDTRTRICIFAMNLELLPGEGANAFSADAQDATGKRYALRIEYVGSVPPALDAQGNITADFRGITMVVVRLADDMGDIGDVLFSLNLHGMSSNRVRIGIGHTGGGPADDLGAVPTPAPVSPPPVDVALNPDTYATGTPSDADAIRFLEQAAWGPNAADLAHIKAVGFQAYLDEQFNAPVANPAKGSNYPDLVFPQNDQAQACPSSSTDPNYNQNVCNRDQFSMYPLRRTFFTGAMYGQDQLRQRVAFALHQILVVSGVSPLNRGSWMTIYLQSLDRHAFGNYRTLLNEITLNPSMGEYLDMRLSTRTNPNENWAREVLQLFSIGVNELNIDGTPKLDAQGIPLPSYSQTTVNEFTKAFTGWNLKPGTIAPATTNWRDPMEPLIGTQHDGSVKTLLNGQVVASCGNNAACAQTDLTAALDNIFNHPNIGPFVGKQLIQHLVTSNPSPAYVARVARVFNNDCDALYPAGCLSTRGNLKAVVKAVLLDPEARGDKKTAHNYGKLREPAQYIVNVLRALNVKSFDKSSTSDGVLDSRSSVDFTGSLDQPVFQPTTVFSYYQPEYEVPGTKILGPAFGILSTSTTLRRANNVNTLIYTGVAANLTSPTAFSPDRPRGTSVDLTNLEANASNPGLIADQLNALMLHGTMSTEVRNSIIAAMTAIPTSDAAFARKRAQVAAYLVATSSQYDIQR